MTDIRARTVKGFCEAYGVGMTKTYELIGAGKIRAVKVGTRTLIMEDSAQEWLASLPLAHHVAHHRKPDGGRKPANASEQQKDGKVSKIKLVTNDGEW